MSIKSDAFCQTNLSVMDAKKDWQGKWAETALLCPCRVPRQQMVGQAGFLRVKVSKLLVLSKLLAFLVLLCLSPLRCVCVFHGFIDTKVSVSAMDFVDSDGTFLNSMNSEFSAALFTFLTGQASVYLCVRHIPSQQIVWTANRDSPASTSDKLVFTPGVSAYLAHADGSNVLWSTNTTGKGVTRMELLDTGNLVLVNAENKTVWQSFDHPTDTLLKDQVLRPQLGMKLVSSISGTNLSSGPYILSLEGGDLHLVFSGYGDIALPYWSMAQESQLVHYVAGAPSYATLNSTGLSLVRNDSVVLSLIPLFSNATMCRATLETDGNFKLYVFSSNVWTPLFTALRSGCDLPLFCGRLGLCSGEQCMCPGSLEPVNKNNITQGCKGSAMSSCAQISSSSHLEKIGDNLDYFANPYVLPSMTSGLEACKRLCMQNCSCSAFFFHSELGFCYIYSQLGTVQSTSSSKHSLFIKMIGAGEASAKGPSVSTPSNGQGLPSFVIPVVVGGSVSIIISMIGIFFYWYCKLRRLNFTSEGDADDDVFLDAIPGLPTRFSYRDLQLATNNFSKKLGTGGFGSVYEGVLADRTKVAVKQLESVGQGKKEFRAEVGIIGSIHHVHLVQLRGFCAEGLHRLLVYEYMSNGSLDKCLFPAVGSTKLLDWNTRYKIALGTARGLAYLHDDCREKIIHCDIKPENILLDENFTAKVSDFGLAKLLNKEQSQVFTTMRGTRGYLAPEWLMNLAISEKSDVYSFGMVLLEIISGRKNYEPSENSEKCYFPAYAFSQAEHGCLDQLVDERLRGTVDIRQAIEAVRIALWCIQEEIPTRPSMTKVVQMLEGNLRVTEPPLSSQFAMRLHARMVEAANSSQHTSATSDVNSQGLVSAVQLSAAR